MKPKYSANVVESLEHLTNEAYLALKKTFKYVVTPEVNLMRTRYSNIKNHLQELTNVRPLVYANMPKEDGVQRYLLQYIIGFECTAILAARSTLGKPIPPGYNYRIGAQLQGTIVVPKKYDDLGLIHKIIDESYNENGYRQLEDMTHELTRTERYDLVLCALDYVKRKYRKMYVSRKQEETYKDLSDFKRKNPDLFKGIDPK
ncbi:MAG: hypothetical protein WC471_04035 [Candidatus Woesearchaeota archaeon]